MAPGASRPALRRILQALARGEPPADLAGQAERVQDLGVDLARAVLIRRRVGKAEDVDVRSVVPGDAQEFRRQRAGIRHLGHAILGPGRPGVVLPPVVLNDGNGDLVRLVPGDAGRDPLDLPVLQRRAAAVEIGPDQGGQDLLLAHPHPAHGPAQSRQRGVPVPRWYHVAASGRRSARGCHGRALGRNRPIFRAARTGRPGTRVPRIEVRAIAGYPNGSRFRRMVAVSPLLGTYPAGVQSVGAGSGRLRTEVSST